MKKTIFCLIGLSSLLAITTGCRSTSDSYSRGYAAGHYAASAPNQQPAVVVQSPPATSYQSSGYVQSSPPQPGTTYNHDWQEGYGPVAVEPQSAAPAPAPYYQGAAPAPYYSGQGQGRANMSHAAEPYTNTTIMPYSAYRGTDEHWYDTPRMVR
jgi:hypothetical protein